MSERSAETAQFIADLQSYSNHRITAPVDIRCLIDIANREGLGEMFLDAIFQAKFAVKTQEVMSRIGLGGEGYDKLSAEFQQSVEKVSALLKTLVKESSDECKVHFTTTYFGLDQECLANFLKLLGDLSWVKNWDVDGKPLPLTRSQTTRASRVRGRQQSEHVERTSHSEELGRIAKSSRLGLLLTILFLVLNPPYSILGWGIGLIILANFLYIVLASYFVGRKEKNGRN